MNSKTLLILFISSFLFSCQKSDEEETATLLGVQITANDRTIANEVFSTRCVTCHGVTGAGDGPASKGLSPHPRNFHDAAWQKSVSNEYITKIICYGGPAVGKSAAMPANPDLTDKGGVVAVLTGKIRSFGK